MDPRHAARLAGAEAGDPRLVVPLRGRLPGLLHPAEDRREGHLRGPSRTCQGTVPGRGGVRARPAALPLPRRRRGRAGTARRPRGAGRDPRLDGRSAGRRRARGARPRRPCGRARALRRAARALLARGVRRRVGAAGGAARGRRGGEQADRGDGGRPRAAGVRHRAASRGRRDRAPLPARAHRRRVARAAADARAERVHVAALAGQLRRPLAAHGRLPGAVRRAPGRACPGPRAARALASRRRRHHPPSRPAPDRGAPALDRGAGAARQPQRARALTPSPGAGGGRIARAAARRVLRALRPRSLGPRAAPRRAARLPPPARSS